MDKVQQVVADEKLFRRVANNVKSDIISSIRQEMSNLRADKCDDIKPVFFSVMRNLAKGIGIKFVSGKFVESVPGVKINDISLLLLPLEKDAERWKALQFIHLENFPQTTCDSCEDSFCFSWYVL